MNKYILINRVQVQNANAIAGFTWGFPAITHFLGFTHNLSRKLSISKYTDISIDGCAVISHKQQVHTFGKGDFQFIQSKNPAYLINDVTKVIAGKAPSIIEEGKMNMTVSLIIGYEGNLGNRQDNFMQWLKNTCLLQRLAGGTILSIADIELFGQDDLRTIKRKLLPGFVLMDRSYYLEEHYQRLQTENPDVELLDAWMDFIAIKQKARPKSDLITQYFNKLLKSEPNNQEYIQLQTSWFSHLEQPYDENIVPNQLTDLMSYFEKLEPKANKKLLAQWQNYCSPTEKTEADWEYIKKPEAGFLVPLMTGYNAISKVYDNNQVENTRDHETPVCFVESVHSIGEWRSVHRLRTVDDLSNTLWRYHYEENWYLCKQHHALEQNEDREQNIIYEESNQDFN